MSYEEDIELERIRREAERRKRELKELQEEELRRIRELEQRRAMGEDYSPEMDSAFVESQPYTDQTIIYDGQFKRQLQEGTPQIQIPFGGNYQGQADNAYQGQADNVYQDINGAGQFQNQYVGEEYYQGDGNNQYFERGYQQDMAQQRGGQQGRSVKQNQQGGKQNQQGRKRQPDRESRYKDEYREKKRRVYDPDQAVSDEQFINSFEEDEYTEMRPSDRHYSSDRDRSASRRSSGGRHSDDRRSESRSSGNNSHQKEKKKKNPIWIFFRNLIIFILILFTILCLLMGNITKRFNHIDTEVSKRPTACKKAVVNILLIGQDARDGESGQRSDSIILLSVNTKKNSVSMTSIMRDTYVDIPGYGGNRINAAYAYGDIDLLDQTIEEDFGVTIDGNAMVDFDGFLTAMTAVGELKMTLTAEEAEYMNANPGFGSNNDASDEVWNLTEGENVLTPSQLLAYSRIRYVGNSDWDRTERQRKVISGAISKVKHGHYISGYKMATQAAPSITTDIRTWGMLRLAFGIMTGGDMKSHIIPVEDTYYSDYIDGMDVLVPDMDANRDYLQRYINGED